MDNHFNHILMEDLMSILKSMRKRHKFDKDSPPDMAIHEENPKVIYNKLTEISQSAEKMTKQKLCDLLLSASNLDISVLSEEEQKLFRECL